MYDICLFMLHLRLCALASILFSSHSDKLPEQSPIKLSKEWLESDHGQRFTPRPRLEFLDSQEVKVWYRKKIRKWLENNNDKLFILDSVLGFSEKEKESVGEYLEKRKGKNWGLTDWEGEFVKMGREWLKSNNGK